MRRKKIQLLYITTGLVVFLIICNSCGHNSRYTNRGVLKNITGIELPPFKIVKDTLLGESLFLGDYDRKCEIEFKEIPSENFFYCWTAYVLFTIMCMIKALLMNQIGTK